MDSTLNMDALSLDTDTQQSLSLEVETPAMISLVLADGTRCEVSRDALRRCNYASAALNLDPNATEIEINFKHQFKFDDKYVDVCITPTLLQKIVEYLNHYEHTDPIEIPKPIRSANLKKVVCEWDADFIDYKKWIDLYTMFIAAHYLEILPLQKLAGAKIASQFKFREHSEILKLMKEEYLLDTSQ